MPRKNSPDYPTSTDTITPGSDAPGVNFREIFRDDVKTTCISLNNKGQLCIEFGEIEITMYPEKWHELACKALDLQFKRNDVKGQN